MSLIKIKNKTYSEELTKLNTEKATKEKEVADKMALVILRNGTNEDLKKTAIRNSILANIDIWYSTELQLLKTKHGV